jgi:hypothetical protein
MERVEPARQSPSEVGGQGNLNLTRHPLLPQLRTNATSEAANLLSKDLNEHCNHGR